ncbi:MAG TPA: glycoside hydrolase family 18 protein [Puia sp.]|nr:glycoside hydrolase family 18 protein [Puia sp.]
MNSSFPRLIALAVLAHITLSSHAQGPAPLKGPAVIGYYAGRNSAIDSFEIEKLTHIIFSFCHLKDNRLSVNNANDSTIIRHLVALKSRNPGLKVILSLGGWGGCRSCPQVFSTRKGRKEFSSSVKELADYFQTDGIDLDWEYPALSNVPGYPFSPADKDNFTRLVRQLRRKLGKEQEISFAAGGFTKYLEQSIDWKKVVRRVNYINLMTYDLVSGYDTISGHHTPLYSTSMQKESTDHAVRWLDSMGMPRSKIAIGVAFYARIFANVDSLNNGLYRPCVFRRGVPYRDQATVLSADSGYAYHWDPVAQAPYLYNASKKFFVSYDDTMSIRLKTRYALERGLGGVMFWQLGEDRFHDGLLNVIDRTKKDWAMDPKKN